MPKTKAPSAPKLTAADMIAKAKGFTAQHVESFRAAVKKGPVEFAELCDKLDLSPAKMRSLIEHAKSLHITVKLAGERVGLGLAEPAVPSVKDVGIAPAGERQRVGVISDLHLGSRYCMRPQLADFVEYAYSLGVREILCPGDVLEGCYKHAQFELTHVSLEDQSQDALETLPAKPGLNYFFITGNHDGTFWEHSGVNVGRYIEDHFKRNGRSDMHFVAEGDRQAYLKVRGAVFDLWHPKSGVGYALSYGVQNRITEYAAIKPQILLIGHWHRFCYVYQRGVRGGPSMGGLVLEWSQTKHGTIRDFSLAPRLYFEREQPLEIRSSMDGIEVDPQVYDPSPKRRKL